MKIVIAPDSFKGSLTAKEAADAMAAGVRRAMPDAEIVCVPMADGGEGTVQSLVDATGGTLLTATVTGPLGTPVDATYGLLGDGSTAVIEMAAASGIGYVDETTRDPRVTTTYGTGELIRDALDHGATSLIVGLGGSATNDGGAGMAQALGVRLLDDDGRELAPGGATLATLTHVDISGLDPRLAQTDLRLASDVTNPLTGERGASAVFGPQKGADEAMVEQLDAALRHYAQVIRQDLERDVEHVPGAGAAGGLGAGFLAFTGARMQSGISLVIEATGLETLAQDADLCLTGEGRIDAQTRYGKTPIGVAHAIKSVMSGCPVVAVAGCVGDGAYELLGDGIDAIFGILPASCTLKEALAHAEDNLERTTENVARLVASFA
ncbi:glycerate kinase [Bifidobacterium cuniculi]|uniref:Glycerate kinase n=1 Tax=Bifidobacterium cuniculi TaxID=1688 RepID=A0A087B3K9_9BIFI|nr:glycerate kinase [Bifidobacterium cuniculi]KFI65609.1 glycerate kinase [Bifidobacterium cuniculi]